MKSTVKILLFLACFLLSQVEALTIQKVRIIGSSITQESVIRNMLPELIEGAVIATADIDSLVAKWEARLMRTQYFDKVAIDPIVSQKDPSKVNIIIDLADGFTDRYGGGAIFGIWGHLNEKGEGIDSIYQLGLNAASVAMENHHIGLKHVTEQTSFGISPIPYTTRAYVDKTTLRVGGRESLLVDLASDLQMGVGVEAYDQYGADGAFENNYIEPSIRLVYDARNRIFNPSAGLYWQGDVGYLFGQDILRAKFDLNHYQTLLSPQLVLMTQASLVAQKGSLTNDGFAYSAVALGFVRAHPAVNVFGFQRYLFRTELRYTAMNPILVDFIDTSIIPYGFIEVGNATDEFCDCLSSVGAYASGVGLKWVIGSPVFVPIDLSWSLSATGGSILQLGVFSTF